MHLQGVLAIVHREDRPTSWVEHFEKVWRMNQNLHLTLKDGVQVVGFTFPCRAPGPDSPAIILHNHPDFLGGPLGSYGEACYSLGCCLNSIDERTVMPEGVEFVGKKRHPIFDYCTLRMLGRPLIAVDNIWEEHHLRNGKLVH